MDQKIEVISNVIKSIKSNPKFIKLLIYSMNSLENFVSPPNREIRVNAKTAGDIIWKCISLNDLIDMELAKLFADILGHEAVIEILLSKDKSQSSKPFIKILNGLSQIPTLIHKLINSGLIETVKLVSDIYNDDFDIIQMNFEIMKKISNLKIGREILMKKNLIPNILKNIVIAASFKNSKGVLIGLNIVDNITRIEGGKESLKDSDVIKHLSSVLDFFENNDEVLKMGAKIYSKIAKPEDILREIEKLKNYEKDEDFFDLNELKKTLILISNFILVEDISKTLCQEENLEIIKNLFIKISNIDLKDKSKEYIKTYVLLNKYFMVIFHRIFNLIPEFFENEEIEKNINKSILNNWNAITYIRQNNDNLEELNSFNKAFSEFFSSFSDFFVKNYHQKEPEENLINSILDFFMNDKIFINDEKANSSACRIMKIANRIKNNHNIKKKILNLFDFLISTVRLSDDNETLTIAFEILHDIYFDIFNENSIGSLELDKDGAIKISSLMANNNLTELARKENINNYLNIRDLLVKIVIEFMMLKPKFRKPSVSNLKILNISLVDPTFLIEYKKNSKELNIIDAVISVMAKHIYESSNILDVLNIEDPNNKVTNNTESSPQNENTEKLISSYGIKILEKLIDEKEVLRIIKVLRDSVNSYIPGKSPASHITELENALLFCYCILQIKNFFHTGLNDLIESLKSLIKKEVSYIENFKKDNLSKEKKEEKFTDEIKSSNKRLFLQTALVKLISENCMKYYEDSIKLDNANKQNLKNLTYLKEILKIILEFFDKSSDDDILLTLLGNLKENIEFLLNYESELNTQELIPVIGKNSAFSVFNVASKESNKFDETIIEKITTNLINLFRKNLENPKISKEICTIFQSIAKKKPEICDLLVKAGCPRLLLTILENASDVELAKKALVLLRTITLSSDENLKMVSNQNIFDKILEISTKYNNNDEMKQICNNIISQLVKLLNQEKYINSIITKCIDELNALCNNPNFESIYEESKQIILENLEKINSFTNNEKVPENILNEEFLSSLNKISCKILNDPEITELNDKLLYNLSNISKKAFLNEGYSGKESEFLDLLFSIINEKSFFRDPFLDALKTLSGLISNEIFYEKFLKNKIDKNLIDSLLSANENYLEDIPVSNEINNLLCLICLRSSDLAQYMIEKGGLYNIIEELKSLIGLNDSISQNKKLFGLKFIESLVKEKNKMEKFIELKGSDLILNMMKSCIQIHENENSSYEENKSTNEISKNFGSEILKNFIKVNSPQDSSKKNIFHNHQENEKKINIFSDYITETCIILHDTKQISENNLRNNKISSNFGKEKSISTLEGEYNSNNTMDNTSSDSNLTGYDTDFDDISADLVDYSENERNTSENDRNKYFIPYLVYCFKIINQNLKFNMTDFLDPRLFKNIIQLLK